jgi:hypothetical protein
MRAHPPIPSAGRCCGLLLVARACTPACCCALLLRTSQEASATSDTCMLLVVLQPTQSRSVAPLQARVDCNYRVRGRRKLLLHSATRPRPFRGHHRRRHFPAKQSTAMAAVESEAISANERDFILRALLESKRADGRFLLEMRKVRPCRLGGCPLQALPTVVAPRTCALHSHRHACGVARRHCRFRCRLTAGKVLHHAQCSWAIPGSYA